MNPKTSLLANRPAIKFILKFLILLILVGILYSQFITSYHEQTLWMMNATAAIAGKSLSIFSSGVSIQDARVTYRGFQVEIIDECTGFFEALIFVAAVLAFAAPIKKKILGIALGVPAIYILNIIRIIFLLLAGSVSQRLFDFMHLYFWQGTLILMISAVWIAWIYLVVYNEKKPADISA
ncbi:conserved membrane hypothetical protein [Candidatus Zixiibacteriota bacterium]|nr:conserved membrane hypothetical protein [candidate division Zixibacteria bacterium]